MVLHGELSKGSGRKSKNHTSCFNRESLVEGVEGVGGPSAGWLRNGDDKDRVTEVVITGRMPH